MGWGLDSPGNQPTHHGVLHERKNRKSKCVNHDKRDAIAAWGVNLERVCLECLEKVIKEYKKQNEMGKNLKNGEVFYSKINKALELLKEAIIDEMDELVEKHKKALKGR